MPTEDLRAEDRGGRIGIGGAQQLIEAIGIRRAVVMDEPDPVDGVRVGAIHPCNRVIHHGAVTARGGVYPLGSDGGLHDGDRIIG